MIATGGPYRRRIVSRPSFLDLLVRSEPFRVFQIILGALLMPVAGIVGLISPAPIGIVIFVIVKPKDATEKIMHRLLSYLK